MLVNEAQDGSTFRSIDLAGTAIEWTLNFKHLSDTELTRLLSFYEDCGGRLLEFTFCDPTDNLLAWSEQLDEPAWEKSPCLNLVPGLADPLGLQGAWQVTNSGPVTARISQTIESPADRVYSFSLYARSVSGSSIDLFRRGVANEAVTSKEIGPAWRHLWTSGGSLESSATSEFGVQLSAGDVIQLFGLQVETQPSPSYYKRTTSHGGIYLHSRLLNDEVEVISDGPGSHAARVGIRSQLSA